MVLFYILLLLLLGYNLHTLQLLLCTWHRSRRYHYCLLNFHMQAILSAKWSALVVIPLIK
jgi:hypothetical protein